MRTGPAVNPPPDGAEPESGDERALIRSLRARNEAVFERIVSLYYPSMIRLARTYVRSHDEAEEVVQDTWLAVLRGIDRFEGRASLKTWIHRILVNRARTRAKRESRSLPFSAVGDDATADSVDTIADGESLVGRGGGDGTGYRTTPEDAVLATELNRLIVAAIDGLPARQRAVITLRDVEGWSAEEVSRLLEISEGNQRVLLHRARVRVRDAIAPYLNATDEDAALATTVGEGNASFSSTRRRSE